MNDNKPMTQAEYLLHQGGKCPACTSTDVEAGHQEANGNVAWVEVKCGECGATWKEVYVLTGYSRLTMLGEKE